MNLPIAQVCLQPGDPAIATRTWQDVMTQIAATKSGSTQFRWQCAIKDKAFAGIRHRKLIETSSEHFAAVLQTGTVATNVYLRRIHYCAVTMHWLPWPGLPKRQWPAIHHKVKRGITAEEHQKIIQRETDPAKRAFYQLLWHLGGAQPDIASLTAEDVDWQRRTIACQRCKPGVISLISYSDEVAEILRPLPATGRLFPTLAAMGQSQRGATFRRRIKTVGISGITLHSYRYAWAVRLLASATLPDGISATFDQRTVKPYHPPQEKP